MPKLKTGDMVVGAQLSLNKVGESGDKNGLVNAYEVTQDWDTRKLVWATRPAINNRVIDTSTENQGWYQWNITSLAKKWYTYGGNNYGISLRSKDPSNKMTFWSSDVHNEYTWARPTMQIYYINNTGLESAWTYHSQDIGRSGIGYVNDYNGNVVFTHSDYEAAGSRLPIKIEHVYNNNDKAENIGYGYGWRLNISQRITEETISGKLWYAYCDEDGTKHYIDKDYKCDTIEDIKFSKNSDGSYQIIDKDKNKLYFKSGGYLEKISDVNGNTNTICYNGNTISKIVDSIGRETVFESTAQGYLLSITDPAGRKITDLRTVIIHLIENIYLNKKIILKI